MPKTITLLDPTVSTIGLRIVIEIVDVNGTPTPRATMTIPGDPGVVDWIGDALPKAMREAIDSMLAPAVEDGTARMGYVKAELDAIPAPMPPVLANP